MADREPSLFDRKQAWFSALVSAGARPGDMLVAHALAGFMLKSEDCWPAQETLRALTGLSRQTISGVVGRLERAQALTVDRTVRNGSRQAPATYALALPFDRERAAAVFLEGRPGRKSPASAHADTEAQGKHAPTSASALGGASVNTRRAQRRREPTERERRESGEEKKEKPSLSPYKKWTAADCEKPCPKGHGPMEARQRHDNGSLFGYCRTCGWKSNPPSEQAARFPSDEEQERKEAALRSRSRGFPYPASTDPAPVGAIASELLARSEAS